jgi:hypothetical protein
MYVEFQIEELGWRGGRCKGAGRKNGVKDALCLRISQDSKKISRHALKGMSILGLGRCNFSHLAGMQDSSANGLQKSGRACRNACWYERVLFPEMQKINVRFNAVTRQQDMGNVRLKTLLRRSTSSQAEWLLKRS